MEHPPASDRHLPPDARDDNYAQYFDFDPDGYGENLPLMHRDVLISSILMGLISVVGLVGNALMLRALIRYRKLRTEFYIVFGALSIADSCFLLISVPYYIIDMNLKDYMTTTWCKSSHYFMNAFSFIVAFLIVVLSVLRGILLTNRNTITRPQPLHLVIACFFIYVLAAASSIPLIFMYTVDVTVLDPDIVGGASAYSALSAPEGGDVGVAGDDVMGGVVLTDRECTVIVDEALAIKEMWLINSFASFIPLMLMLVIYLLTYLLGKRYFSDSYSRREKEKSRLVTSIILAFAVCQIPYRCVSIYEFYVYLGDYANEDDR